MSAEEQLASFLERYTPEICRLGEQAVAAMRRRYPTATVMVYDNYNALAVGFCPGEKASEAIFSIALYPRWVSLFFLQARGLADPEKMLRGSGTVARHIVLTSAADLKKPAIRNLMLDAEAIAKVSFPATGEGNVVIKSISAKQRPRRPAQ
jgi:hypothetical protein